MLMKKFFTLIAVALFAVGVNAQNEVDIPLTAENWGWGWGCTVSNEGDLLVGTLTGDWGAMSIGWGSADWSAYSKLCVVIESYNNDWGKVTFKDEAETYVPEVTFNAITSQTTVTLNFDSEKAVDVYQLLIQGKTAGDVIKVSRVYLVEKVSYQEGKALGVDEWGNILASEFEGYSDKAKVEFTVSVTGEATNADGSVLGWGIGTIKSINCNDTGVNPADVVTVGSLTLGQIGDNVYIYTVGELKAALEAPANQYGLQGINWNVWDQGNAKCSRKSVMVFEVKGADKGDDKGDTDGINVAKTQVENGAIYSINGQKVDANYKGIVIMNGKKYIQK